MSRGGRWATVGVGGALLMVRGALHLAVTPIIARLIAQDTSPAGAEWLTPPMLLNHVVVGILLLPLGGLTFYAAPGAARGEPWALVVTPVTTIAAAALPLPEFVFMGRRYFAATPFVAATIALCAACLALLAAAFWPAP